MKQLGLNTLLYYLCYSFKTEAILFS